jgi:hypothetical protein
MLIIKNIDKSGNNERPRYTESALNIDFQAMFRAEQFIDDLTDYFNFFNQRQLN